MSYGLYLSTAGMQATDYRQSVLANNLANTTTTGFKRDLAIFQERPVESMAKASNRRYGHDILDRMTGGLFVTPTIHTFEQGNLERTEGPLDVALQGDGFLSVSDGSETRFTRDGRMTINAAGQLVMVAGSGRFRVLDDSGQPIKIDSSNSGALNIASDGTIRQGSDVVARLSVVEFADRGQLVKIGSNLYRNHGDAPNKSIAQVMSGYIEASTANPITGLGQMIRASRAYQLNANLVSLQDNTLGQVVNTVGRIA
jgi:flagellar basal-body rod protein FlgF